MAYLKQQYKVVIIVFIVLAVIFYLMSLSGMQNEWVWFAFLTGGFFSGLAGFFGMKTATYASARTANAARKSLNSGLKVAFRSGAVMGLVVVGLALLDVSVWFIVLDYFVEMEGPTKLVFITTTMPLTLFAYAKTAGVLQGTQCPCVVSSRADSPESKYYSLALAAI